MKGEGITLTVMSVVFLFSAWMALANAGVTGYASEGSSPSNVSIQTHVAIAFSGNLSQGIQFGAVDVLPALNINATANDNGALSGTGYFINVSTDSNSNVKFCVKGSGNLEQSPSVFIGLGNETYAHSSTTDVTDPDIAGETFLTTSYVEASAASIAPGDVEYYRFWLDIPGGTLAGDYNNTIFFKGVEAAGSC